MRRLSFKGSYARPASHWIQRDVIDYLINFLSSSNNSTLQEAVPEVGASRSR